MASLVRVTVLGCAIATANSRWFQSSDDAQSWNPALETGQNTDPDPPGWTPKPTPAPGPNNLGLELRQDDDYSIATCATRFMSTLGGITQVYPVTCGRGSFCSADEENERVGCCSERDAADCIIPIACVEVDLPPFRPDPSTMYCYGNVYDGYEMFTCGSWSPGIISVGHTSSFEYHTTGTSLNTAMPPPITLPRSETTDLAPSTTSPTSSSSGSEAPTAITVTVEPSRPLSAAQGAGGSNSSKTGAIVGGVVGGLGGIALIAAIIFFLYLRKKKAKAAASPDYITPLGPTYYPGPEDPPLHPNQYGSLSQSMGQVTQRDAPGTGYPPASYPPAAAMPVDRHANRAPSPYYPMSPKTAEDDAAVSPIESTPSVSPPDSPQSPYARTVSPTMPPVQYNRFSPPPPQQFQAYRPYPGT
ncbi:hypothetical protein DL762_003943 [Monosporascus cannonballus]|uniref:Mid2 domain-containing protein n=1 Tax=Monosporascus cannonballus TaxID=155416 RepID=A0ABY0H968_9PEZI|nr:hypothetical protein DL762_003943 [Monosporascus cannonballus]